MDVLLINPNGRSAYAGLGSLPAVENPVWCGLIAGYLRKHGLTVGLIDANAPDLTPSETADIVKDINPGLVAVVVYGHNPSASTQNMPNARAIIGGIKTVNPEMPVAILGGHVAALPERTKQEEQADYIIADEGFDSLVKAYRDSRAYVTRKKIIVSGEPVADLDFEIGDMAWDLYPMFEYRAHNWHCYGGLQRQPYAAIYTSLGCPYNCSFCCIKAPFQFAKPYRVFSPERVVRQIETIYYNYGVRNIKFADELFLFDYDHVSRICDLLIRQFSDLNIWAYARVDRLRPDVLKKMREAGITWLGLGIESGSQAVLRNVKKGYHKSAADAVKMIHNAGINIVGNYIFGLPEDNYETMQETLDLALKLNCEYANLYCVMAYPGSELYDRALKEGWPLPKDWSGYSQLSPESEPLRTRYLTGREVLEFRDKAFMAYFANPDYLNMMGRKFGKATRLEIQEMTKHKLERAQK